MTNTCHTVVNVVYAQPDSKEFGTMRISSFSLGYNESQWLEKLDLITSRCLLESFQTSQKGYRPDAGLQHR